MDFIDFMVKNGFLYNYNHIIIAIDINIENLYFVQNRIIKNQRQIIFDNNNLFIV